MKTKTVVKKRKLPKRKPAHEARVKNLGRKINKAGLFKGKK